MNGPQNTKLSVGEVAAEWWTTVLKRSISNGFVKNKNKSRKSILKTIQENGQSSETSFDFFKYFLAKEIDGLISKGLEVNIFTGDDVSTEIISRSLANAGFKPDTIGWPQETEMDITSESIVTYNEFDHDPTIIWKAERFPPIM